MTERLWAPWRDAYVAAPSKEALGCIFCAKPREDVSHDRANLIVLREAQVFVILNAFPYNPGHLMVVPYAHVADFPAADPAMLAEMMTVAQHMVSVLRATMRPDSFNIGMNLGRSAGAGIADHMHLHVVPRWGGDNNFMPVLDDTRVVPQALDDTYMTLLKGLAEVPQGGWR